MSRRKTRTAAARALSQRALDTAKETLAIRLLETLERLLEVPAADLKVTLTAVCDVVARATGCDKVDAFLYDPARDSLYALGTSTQPLSSLQRKLGLDVLPVTNGGRVVQVFETGRTFVTGRLQDDPEELRGIKEGLKIRSKLGVPLEIAGRRRGMMMLASQKDDFFTPEDVRLMEAVGRWVGIVAHHAELAEQIGRNAAEQGRRAVAEELVTVLAHDLRNYLAPLDMRLNLLRRRAAGEGRADDLADLEQAMKAVSRISSFVGEILDVARLDRGVFGLAPQPVDLAALLRELGEAMTTDAHPIEVRIAENSVVAADPAQLRQCLANLLSNAMQKSPDRAPVSVILGRQPRAEGEWARVEVIDQGPGIPSELLPRIFERFVSGKAQEGGLGLGLYLAKRIAAAHGGDLSVDSAPGQGARFVLLLPRV